MSKVKQFYKTLVVAALSFALIGSGIGVANARSSQSGHAQTPPAWEEVSRDIKANPARPVPPDVREQLVSLKVAYKDFSQTTKHGIVEVNRALKDDAITYFKYAYYLNFPFKEIAVSSDPRFAWDDNKLMDANVTSCFNYRTIAGTDRPSQHGLGRACDFNPRQNPYITLDDQGNPVTQPKSASWLSGTPGL